ncbi:cation diffusion facilitator family transporter [Actinoplanes regularis]|uniref:cation diffusion facilitator family transporter n=1 Tax=Actinoplanes regularis TaxID=52697 RepID=UPI0024A23122|nr:cation diffusion facilitator family transporter [Actinoplanes regularis]GLW30278.1 cation diffusion facilitator transporter [Actinoplanes regularis]
MDDTAVNESPEGRTAGDDGRAQAGGGRTAERSEKKEGSAWTVLVAVIANLAIAIAKIVAGLLTGSASMWAEAAHSIADTGNEVLLLVGLRRSRKGPDGRHPFGYGQERYFWTFLAALGIFLIGGVLSIGEGVRSLLAPEPVQSLWVGVGVLVVAAGFEGYSWRTAHKQLREEARERDRSMRHHLRHASDPSATTVFLEDTAALIGLAVALTALILHALTGWAGWDAVGSMTIGLLLVVVAFLLARRSKALLLEESAPADVLEPIRERVGSQDWVARIGDLHAVWVGPSQLLVNLWVTPTDGADLVDRVTRLRRGLLADDMIAQVTVTLEPG